MRRPIYVLGLIVLSVIAFAWHAAGGFGAPGSGAISAGDSNGDGSVNISDAVHVLNFLFNGGPSPASCQQGSAIFASDVSFDATGTTLNPGSVQTVLGEVDERLQAMSLQGSSFNTRLLALEGAVDLELVEIPAGSFTMGSPTSERSRNADETLHGVTISKSFFMGATEVTQAEFRAIMGSNPSVFAGCPNCPVENVNWYDAVEFCDRLTERHRAEGKIAEDAKYRLPTESEWEYACRAGASSRFSFGDSLECDDGQGFCPSASPYLWFEGNNSLTAMGTKPVKQKAPNPWGLYDMHGNVFEWCHDAYAPYPAGEVTDPNGPEGGLQRVLRGGYWQNPLYGARSALRYHTGATERDRSGAFGFRVVLET